MNGSSAYLAPQWGLDSDEIVPEDFDGDDAADFAVWREDTGDPDRSTFYILQSQTATVRIEQFGRQGDSPKVVADYDGDGKADPAVFRANGGAADPCGVGRSVFYWRPSGSPGTDFLFACWGTNGDDETVGDFDGDGRADFCVRRIVGGNGIFYLLRSSDGGVEGIPWSITDDAIVPGDYDNDGRNDFIVARVNGTNGEVYILERDGGGTGASPIIFGNINPDEDFIAHGDYDGDGRTDLGIWKGLSGLFAIRRTSDGSFLYFAWGAPGDETLSEWHVNGGN